MRAGTAAEPVAASHVAVLTTGSEPCACTGERTSDAPARPETFCLTEFGVALNTTTRPFRAGSASVPCASSMRITMTPSCASAVPLAGKDTLALIASAEPSRNSGVENRSRRRSWAWLVAALTSEAAGFSAGSPSSGFMYDHLSLLSPAGGRP